MCRDTGTLDGDRLNVVEVVSIHWTEDAAAAEVDRLRTEAHDDTRWYYRQATKIARR